MDRVIMMKPEARIQEIEFVRARGGRERARMVRMIMLDKIDESARY